MCQECTNVPGVHKRARGVGVPATHTRASCMTHMSCSVCVLRSQLQPLSMPVCEKRCPCRAWATHRVDAAAVHVSVGAVWCIFCLAFVCGQRLGLLGRHVMYIQGRAQNRVFNSGAVHLLYLY